MALASFKGLAKVVVSHPSMMPKIIPPRASWQNSKITLDGVKDVVDDVLSSNSVMNKTIPTPSLNNDSPATHVESFLETPSRLKVASTAMGSVGDMSEPNNRQ